MEPARASHFLTRTALHARIASAINQHLVPKSGQFQRFCRIQSLLYDLKSDPYLLVTKSSD